MGEISNFLHIVRNDVGPASQPSRHASFIAHPGLHSSSEMNDYIDNLFFFFFVIVGHE